MRLADIDLFGKGQLYPERLGKAHAFFKARARNIRPTNYGQNNRGCLFWRPAVDQVSWQSVLVFILEEIDRRVWRDGRDGVFVYQLRRAPFTFEQHAEVIEPGNDALELDAVHKEHGQGSLALPHGVEENVLQVLFFVSRHGCCEPSLLGPCRTFSLSYVE
jgi:hypothetical protein